MIQCKYCYSCAAVSDSYTEFVTSFFVFGVEIEIRFGFGIRNRFGIRIRYGIISYFLMNFPVSYSDLWRNLEFDSNSDLFVVPNF